MASSDQSVDKQTFYQRHLLAEALCGHSLWRDIQHASGELPGPTVFKDELRALRSQLGKSHEDQWIERLTALGAEPVGSSPEEFGAFMKSETAKWARVIKEANIRAD